ncbi:hypothetical protein AB1Y20_000796 [Prymnesium parvum]|uniref:Feruloyl esterase n=1 Tax=Prymnesium parvum TaxID=97485 RepID=A0AB34K6X3_PRYPA
MAARRSRRSFVLSALFCLSASRARAPLPANHSRCCALLRDAQTRRLGCARLVRPSRAGCALSLPRAQLCCTPNGTATHHAALAAACGCAGETAPPPPARGGTTSDRCVSSPTRVSCEFRTLLVGGRSIYYQYPSGRSPGGGFPTVLIFHAWGVDGRTCFEADVADDFRVFPKAKLARNLLDAGFAVVCPQADSPYNETEGRFWWSNIPPYDGDEVEDLYLWNYTSPDHAMLMNFLHAAENASIGPLDTSRLHAAGFSSGAYMVSRLARWQYQRFASLSLNAGAMYYCGGEYCPAPRKFLTPYFGEHPPTLFLHGDKDDVVSRSSVVDYYTRLLNSSIKSRLVTQADAVHQWLDAAPDEVVSWIQEAERQYLAGVKS